MFFVYIFFWNDLNYHLKWTYLFIWREYKYFQFNKINKKKDVRQFFFASLPSPLEIFSFVHDYFSDFYGFIIEADQIEVYVYWRNLKQIKWKQGTWLG